MLLIAEYLSHNANEGVESCKGIFNSEKCDGLIALLVGVPRTLLGVLLL